MWDKVKNGIHYPFERNKYFFGKLLTVSDFESEQRYYNDKRRLLNRALEGCGIVCGLNVVLVDNEREISIEKGVALDYQGREIIVDAPLHKTLPMIQGFNIEKQGDCYLCLEYNEVEAEPVHSIVDATANDGHETPKNKYRETYRLSITYNEGDELLLHGYNLILDRQVIYEDENLRVTQTCPKYISSGEEFPLEVEVKFLQDLAEQVRFSYTLASHCLKDVNGKREIDISFDEKDYAPSSLYKAVFLGRATVVNGVKDMLRVIPDSFRLYKGDTLFKYAPPVETALEIVSGDIREKVRQKFYDWSMDDVLRSGENHRLYLARIRYVGASSTYAIREIENVPYRQYVTNPVLNEIDDLLNKQKWQRLATGQGQVTKEFGHMLEELVERNNAIVNSAGFFATGLTEVDFGLNGRKGKKFFSNEVIHGLGQGHVQIMLGISTEDDRGAGKGYAIYGDAAVFQDVDFAGELPSLSMGAMADFENGTFRVGVKLLSDTDWSRVKICWFAYKAAGDQAEYLNLRRNTLKIKPDILRLTAREVFKFETEGLNVPSADQLWSVVDEQGGSIDDNGIYTAPDQEGIYELRVADRRNAEVEARAYVIVKES